MDSEEYEVFFTSKSKNNPNKKVPNWFYYWNQTSIGNKNAIYEDRNFFAEVSISWNQFGKVLTSSSMS